jgi:predicted transcriptional regulator of viral defense system
MKKDVKKEIIGILKKKGFVRPKDLAEYGIRREYLSRLYKEGLLSRNTRGVYYLNDAPMTENNAMAMACKRVPHGVICLLTALRFHNIGTQNPSEIWMAIGEKTWRPKLSYPKLKIVRFCETSLTTGIETHTIEGVPVKVFNPAKTIADCFKYRNKIGLDVFLEAVKECQREKRCTHDEIWKYAKACRISGTIRPYLEAMA